MIQRYVAFAGLLLILGELQAAPAKAVSDDEARIEALANQVLARALWPETKKSCLDLDDAKQSDIMRMIDARIREQPINHSKFQARLNYSACRQMLTDVGYINGACANKAPTKIETDYADRNWIADSGECERQIATHSESRDSAGSQTDEEIAAQLRREGNSEDDIKFIMNLRNN